MEVKAVLVFLVATGVVVYFFIGIFFAIKIVKCFAFYDPNKPFVFIFTVWFWPFLLIDFLEKRLDKEKERGERK